MSGDQVAIDGVKEFVTEAEWAVREDLAAAYRLIAHYGWDDMVFTHLSARVPGPEEHFLLNPFGFLFSEVTASNLVKIDCEGNVVLNNGYRVNTAGFTIHSAVHMSRPDARAVMHLHTNAGVAVSSMACGFLPLTQHALFVYYDTAYHEWEGVATNLEERERLIADLGDKHLMILRNHGTLAVGASVASCFMRMYYLERACRIQVDTLSGGEPHMPDQSALGRMRSTFADPKVWEGLAKQSWPALRRLAETVGPDYRT